MNQSRGEDIRAYIHCMEEIKRRMVVVSRVLNRETNTGYLMTNAELLAVQLRKIAELIALSSICSHREAYERIRVNFHRDWNARYILRDVERINPNFYPKPTRQIKDPESGKVTMTENIEESYLTQAGLIQMVDASSGILHAFNPYRENLLNLDEFIDRCKQWHDQILTLLSHHQVQLVNSDSQWWVVMHAGSDGKVHVAEMRRVERADS